VKKLLLLTLGLGLAGCSTVSPVNFSTITPAQAAAVTADTSAIVLPILIKNPAYKKDVALLGASLPGLLANGPITISSYTTAVAAIPGITVTEQADLSAAGAVLDLALNTYAVFTNQTVVLYTDPNVAAIVNAFSAGLVAASK
jgi:hypothetical protein